MTFLKPNFLLAIAVVSMFGCSENIREDQIFSENPLGDSWIDCGDGTIWCIDS